MLDGDSGRRGNNGGGLLFISAVVLTVYLGTVQLFVNRQSCSGDPWWWHSQLHSRKPELPFTHTDPAPLQLCSAAGPLVLVLVPVSPVDCSHRCGKQEEETQSITWENRQQLPHVGEKNPADLGWWESGMEGGRGSWGENCGVERGRVLQDDGSC